MSNVAGKAYGMTVITPMTPARTWLNGLIFMVSRAFPSTLGALLGLKLIHFARWVIVRCDQWPHREKVGCKLASDYMLFVSNFNGTWDQYIDAFADGVPNGLDLMWYSSIKYPKSISITPFKNYIRHNQIDNNYYYNATPGSAQRDIKAALQLLGAIRELADKHAKADPASFAAAYRKKLIEVQYCLASPGYAPVASLDTENADKSRKEFVDAARKGITPQTVVAARLTAAAPASSPTP
jgi:hypothetical protein